MLPPCLRHTRSVAIIKAQARPVGMRTFQPSFMSWSYLIRGRDPRSQTNRKRNRLSFARNHSTGHHPLLAPDQTEMGQTGCQPPRKSVVASADTVIMLMYSARQNSANFSEEYSGW